ncbi:HAD family hydrolase [Paenibacillus aurantius]|uniref:HAD family hydrolase n=1 Tax=Paenibacillus aurantius TaxID=2918900 RepID=A0AA96LJU9_9BACL|nr:HAD family hydrolase [Paenibacillus aurantius]WJH33002.1 HAD family hydrolase [Paenibacillus sp. CC-CFT747]WNQ13430.1 HAD family hydrolase [Paenibacillus aurantius]
MERQLILFDMDDTLIHCNKYFDLVLEQFKDQMTTWFASYRIDPKEFEDKQLEIDTIGVSQFGFTEDHFPQSLVETYEHFAKMTGRSQNEEEKKWLLQIGKSVYEAEVEPYPYMVETLEELQADGHTLYLYTGGVAAIQQRKVEAFKLETFFGNRIFIRQHKTTASLERILTDHGFDRSKTWMIGNSIRTDIIPALETGIHAIYIPAMTEWQYNMMEINVKPQGAFYTVPALTDVRETIKGYVEEKRKTG